VPELPDLTVIAEQLAARASGRHVAEAEAPTPILLRATPTELSGLSGTTLASVRRRGKFIVMSFVQGGLDSLLLAVNPMLAGRFWLLDEPARVRSRTGLRISFTDRGELRYVDRLLMGKIYLVRGDKLDAIPGWTEMGPDADDPALTVERFRERIRRHPGELKPLLRNAKFVAGIGNAYSDEILWEAQLAPFRRRTTLSPDDIDRLYGAMRSVLSRATDEVRLLVGERIEEQHREPLRVHLHGGEPCPRCGRPLRQIGGSEATTFCRTCQPPL
jgi:formamidopyrimidine-DNA glycosylase